MPSEGCTCWACQQETLWILDKVEMEEERKRLEEEEIRMLPHSQDPDEVIRCVECLLEDCECDKPEEDDEPTFVGMGLKAQPRFTPQDYDEPKDYMLGCHEQWAEVESEEPDLWRYLSYFGLTELEMVGVCRTFANYVAKRIALKNRTKKTKAQTTTRTAARKLFGTSKRARVDIDLCDDE